NRPRHRRGAARRHRPRRHRTDLLKLRSEPLSGGNRVARPLHRSDRGLDDLSEFQRSEEHTSELQSRFDLVCRLLLEKKNHTHNFIAVMGMAACLALIHIRWRERYTFFAGASASATPQLLRATLTSAADASTFIARTL